LYKFQCSGFAGLTRLKHALKLWVIDPGVVLQKLVVEISEVKQFYLGPPESYNGAIKTKKVYNHIDSLPGN